MYEIFLNEINRIDPKDEITGKLENRVIENIQNIAQK